MSVMFQCPGVGTGSVLFDGEPLRPQSPPPRLGQHNGERAVLADQWRVSGRAR
jgi:hypothetical protein